MNNPLGKTHKSFITSLEGEDRLQAWKVFTERYWREPAGTTPEDKVEFLFRRGFYRNRLHAYKLESEERAERYLSDFQAALLNRVNGVYANVVNDRMLVNHALSAYCRVPKIYALRGLHSSEIALDPVWSAHHEGTATQEQNLEVLIQPLDSSIKGRTEIVKIKQGQFEGFGKQGDMSQLRDIVYGWSEAVNCAYVFSELLPQGSFASSLNPATANHLHVIIGRDHETWEPHIARAHIEIGTSSSGQSSSLDKGGVSADIELKSGTIKSCKYINPQGEAESIKKHPDTKHRLLGLQVPEWELIKKRLMTIFDESSYFRFCAFNFAMLDNGQLGLLGTAKPDVFATQVHRPLLEDPIVAAQLRSLKL